MPTDPIAPAATPVAPVSPAKPKLPSLPAIPSSLAHTFKGVVIGVLIAAAVTVGCLWWNTNINGDIVLPGQKIVGVDKTYPLGELVDLSISPLTTKPNHFVSAKYIWKVYENDNTEKKNVRIFDNGAGVSFGSGTQPKKFKVLCVATYLYNPQKTFDTRTEVLTADINVGGLVPSPVPAPGPAPLPPKPTPPVNTDPTFETGKYGLADWAYQAAKTSVTSATRSKAAQALSGSFNGIAASVAAGTLKDPKDLLQKTTASNDSALSNAGVSKEEWGNFFKAVQDHIFDLYDKGQISTAEDFAEAWKELALGLSPGEVTTTPSLLTESHMSDLGYQIAKDYENGKLCGWAGVDKPDFVKEQFMLMSPHFKEFSIQGQTRATAGRKMFLHQLTRKVLGKDTPNNPQQIGDCVSFGGAHATEYVTCSEIIGVALQAEADGTGSFGDIVKAAALQWKPVFPSYYYGTSRIYVGGNQINGDGSMGSWLAKAVQVYGTLFSDTPGVPAYSGAIARQWGSSKNIIDKWQPTAKGFVVKSAALIRSWDDLVASVTNGYPCPTASNIGYNMEASSDGFHRQTQKWGHQMCIIGVDETYQSGNEPYGLILNNWGDVHGHLKDFQTNDTLPIGILRVRRADIEKHIAAGETFAYSQFNGFPEVKLDKALFYLA